MGQLLVRVAPGDELKDIALAAGEARRLGGGPELLDHRRQNLPLEPHLAPAQSRDRFLDQRRWRGLFDAAPAAESRQANGVFVPNCPAHRQNLDAVAGLAGAFEELRLAQVALAHNQNARSEPSRVCQYDRVIAFDRQQYELWISCKPALQAGQIAQPLICQQDRHDRFAGEQSRQPIGIKHAPTFPSDSVHRTARQGTRGALYQLRLMSEYHYFDLIA